MSGLRPASGGCGPAELAIPQGLPGATVPQRGKSGSPNACSVFVADDDAANQATLLSTLSAAGLGALACSCPSDFLKVYNAAAPACLLLGTRAWGRDGLEVCDALAARQINVPFVFFVHACDVPGAVRALRKGAVNVLAPPFGDVELLESVEDALRRDAWLRQQSGFSAESARRLARLSGREREILDLVVAGRGNKAIARALGIARRTLGFHLANVMRKTEVETVIELVRMVLTLQNHNAVGIPLQDSTEYRVKA